jgi:anti-sigma factor RsiW
VADEKRLPDEDDMPEAATEELVAYLDGELDPMASESMSTRISLDPRLRAKAEAYQRTWDILDVLPRPEPSSTFANRTLSQAIPRLSGPTLLQLSLAVPTKSPFPSPRPTLGFWFVSLILVMAAGAGGYFGHRAIAPPPMADPALEDVPLMKNMRLYRNVDDMEYLKRLDSPELFGENE